MKTELMKYVLFPLYKTKIVMKAAFFTPKALFMVPAAVAIPVLVSYKTALLFLLSLMAIDFITGLWASYKTWRVENPHVKLTYKNIDTYIQSDRLKRSGIKIIMYALSILLIYNLEVVFLLKPFDIKISSASFTLTIVMIAFWCVVELYSILFENFKTIGFDVMSMIRKIKNTKKEILKDERLTVRTANTDRNNEIKR